MTPTDRTRIAKPGLIAHEGGPYNAETPVHWLDEPITPVERFFVRNNGDCPDADPATWRLAVDGFVERTLSLSVDDLARDFETVTITSVLECAGNGRSTLDPDVEGVPWGLGAVGCARFTGVRMRDVLAAAGVKPQAVYTAHHSPDRTESGKPALSRGLPRWKALAPETLIAFAMNGAPLPLAHGGPLRVVAPGFPGSAWQKWLARLELRDREHDGAKMTGLDYRLPTVPVRPGATPDPATFAVIEDMPVKALVTHPAEGASLAIDAPCEIRGFAWSGHTPVERVHVSTDGGVTWAAASLEAGEGPFAWRRFRFPWIPDRPGLVTLLARAADAAGRVQPLDQSWNPRGYCNNGCQRVTVAVG